MSRRKRLPREVVQAAHAAAQRWVKPLLDALSSEDAEALWQDELEKMTENLLFEIALDGIRRANRPSPAQRRMRSN